MAGNIGTLWCRCESDEHLYINVGLGLMREVRLFDELTVRVGPHGKWVRAKVYRSVDGWELLDLDTNFYRQRVYGMQVLLDDLGDECEHS